jgi:5-methyltetrahydropteroyltriglutamate--homocysteine methyltransferase
MTRWFDTNYHYIVPEIEGKFELEENRSLKSYILAKEKLGIDTTPTTT